MENCRTTSCQRIFTFEERRSRLTLINQDGAESIKITVDGCAIKDGIRCDFLHIAKEIEMYIELKGQDIEHAIQQIETTMRRLSANFRTSPKTSYIICTRSPLSSTEIQHHARQFRSKYNSRLVIKSSPFTDSY